MIDYWNGRMKKCGHTGWSDPAIYAFDQEVRIQVVKEIINNLDLHKKDQMLDFGCGTGDFAKAFEGRYGTISLFDISNDALEYAINRIDNGIAIESFDKLSGKDFENKYDLILSITVLQHILDDLELSNTLDTLYKSLNDGGVILILESLFGVGNAEQRSWEIPAFEEFIFQSNFKILKKYDFYYPDENNKDFKPFICRMDVRFLRKLYNKLSKSLSIRKMIEGVLQRIAKIYNKPASNFYSEFSERPGTKIYVLVK